MIYFIKNEKGSVKIGFTNSIERRLKALQTSSSDELTLIGVMFGDKAREKLIHECFRHSKIRGEWFKSSPHLLAFIKDNAFRPEAEVEKPKNELEVSIGNSIKNIRLQKNLTREELTKQANVSMNALRHLENGTGASLKTLTLVVKAFNRESWIEALFPEISINPLYMTKDGKPRQRARKPV